MKQSSSAHVQRIPSSSARLDAAVAGVKEPGCGCEACTGAAVAAGMPAEAGVGVEGGWPCWGAGKGDCALVLPRGWSSSACTLSDPGHRRHHDHSNSDHRSRNENIHASTNMTNSDSVDE